MSIVTPNQSFLLKNKIQWPVAASLSAFVRDIRGPIVAAMGQAWDHPAQMTQRPTEWRLDNQLFRLTPTRQLWVKFSSPRWDPDSDMDYGERKVMENFQVSDDAKSKIIRNLTDAAIHVAYEEAEGVTDSFASTVTKGVTLDVTKSKEAGVDTEVTVKGEYGGVGAEASVAAHFGISEERSESSSTELGKEKAEEGSTEESLAIEFDAEARTNYLVTIVKEHKNIQQPFSINGIMDFDFHLFIDADKHDSTRGRLWKYCPHGIVHLSGVAGLEQFMRGWDTNYPKMEGYWSAANPDSRYGVEWIMKPSSRLIQASGISHESLESNVDYTVEALGERIPDSLAHLPVVNAEDV